jgi:hypothetical protein
MLFVAVDISDANLFPLMQALPNPCPFIQGTIGQHGLEIDIELPPLIPGRYLYPAVDQFEHTRVWRRPPMHVRRNRNSKGRELECGSRPELLGTAPGTTVHRGKEEDPGVASVVAQVRVFSSGLLREHDLLRPLKRDEVPTVAIMKASICSRNGAAALKRAPARA